jgi:hypothetical protein
MRALDQLTECKGQFDAASGSRAEKLLERLSRTRIRAAGELIRLHETALFLRAYPQTPRVAELADQILFGFAERLRSLDLDGFSLGAFDDPEISGIAGTSVSTNFSREFALSLARRHAGGIEIDWEDFENPGKLGVVLGRLIPAAYEDYAVAPHPDWRGWMERAKKNARWLMERVDAATYELLEIPLRWELCAASRSALRLPRSPLFYHSVPLLKRADVSIKTEMATPPIALTRLPLEGARAVLGAIVDASAARYRELYGFQHPDEKRVQHADLGRGVDLYFFGVRSDRRLPVHAYHSGMYFKNGVPMGYVEALSRNSSCEVGFNLYYTFREGETAWLYARILKLLRERLGVTRFSIDPYQLGHENEEAIESGAFWFYYKLGFRPVTQELAALAEREAAKIASRPGYRSSPAMLRRLAAASLMYQA